MDASEILVIILSLFLAFFLLLAIMLTVLLIKVTRQIKDVTTTAQSAVNNISSITSTAAKYASPALVMKLVASQLKKMTK